MKNIKIAALLCLAIASSNQISANNPKVDLAKGIFKTTLGLMGSRYSYFIFNKGCAYLPNENNQETMQKIKESRKLICPTFAATSLYMLIDGYKETKKAIQDMRNKKVIAPIISG